jgi:hypothetical protein
MIIKPIEEFEIARYRKYQKDITELGEEFTEWAKKLQDKYLGDLTDAQRNDMMFRFSDDLQYIVAIDVAKLLGKK